MTTLTTEQLDALTRAGFKRWTKGALDRMYINAGQLGLVLDYYNTGNVRDAHLNGESISNSQGRRLKEAKTFLDLTSLIVYSGYESLAHLAADRICEALQATYEAGQWDRTIQITLPEA